MKMKSPPAVFSSLKAASSAFSLLNWTRFGFAGLSAIIAGFYFSVPNTVQAITVTVGAETQIAHASGSEFMHFPFSYAFVPTGTTTKRIIVGWAANGDGGAANNRWCVSDSSGSSFGAIYAPPPNLSVVNMVQRNDGAVISIPFSTTRVSGTQFTFSYFQSGPGSLTGISPAAWATYTNGSVTFPSTVSVAWIKFHRGIVKLSDGTLLAPSYGQWYTTPTSGTLEPSWRAMLLRSTNGGVSWSYVNTIAYTTTMSPGYNETTLVKCKNGSLLAVMRRDHNAGTGSQPLVSRRSTNNGVSWLGLPAALPGLTTANSTGVDPQLLLMPNGILALAWGKQLSPTYRRAPHIAFSADGNGTSWSNDTPTHTISMGTLESSGYTAMVSITNNRLLVVGDNGSDRSFGTPHPSPNPYFIWKKYIDVVP